MECKNCFSYPARPGYLGVNTQTSMKQSQPNLLHTKTYMKYHDDVIKKIKQKKIMSKVILTLCEILRSREIVEIALDLYILSPHGQQNLRV